MNLLPKDHGEFVKSEYWEQFFVKRGSKAFEWYGDYPELCGVLHKYIRTQEKMLVVGCGNSQLSADLYDVGYQKIVNIDISDTVINQMKEKNKQQRSNMKFIKMDVLHLEFPDAEFSVVLDKGMLDALLVDSSEKVLSNIDKMFTEIDRVLTMMGRYMCISLLQEHVAHKLLHYFAEKHWAIRIHRIHTNDAENSSKDFHMPVFALVFTKFKKTPNLSQLLEVCRSDDKIERFTSVDQMIIAVKEMQYYTVIKQRISKKMVTDQLSLSLYSDVTAGPRYTLTIVDSMKKQVNKFAIFITPQGRETEWMFCTDEGRKQLSESAGFERLVIVTLDRNHTYTDLDSIQAELSTKVMELAPPSFKLGTKVPFLSIGNDIGSRKVCKRGHSQLSGDYVVEEVLGEKGFIYRRLVFLKNENIVQSETKLTSVKREKKGKGKQSILIVDKHYLACKHHISMAAGLYMVQCDRHQSLAESNMSVLIVGLGGGGLPSYIHTICPQVTLDVVDIDPEMISVATEWFGFCPDSKLQAHVDDGLKFIQTEKEKGNKRHVIMLDVDNKDFSVGMSCPPKPFVELTCLQSIKDILYVGGVFVLNLVARDVTLKKEVIDTVKVLFPNVFIHEIEDEVNDVIYALQTQNNVSDKDLIDTSVEHCQHCIKSDGKESTDVDFVGTIRNIKIV